MIFLYLLLSFLICAISIPVLISFSKKKKIFDFPDGDSLKIHKNPISIFGGSAMAFSLIVVFSVFGIKDHRFFYFIISFLPVFLLGLWDDLKWKHISNRQPYVKFLFLIVCCSASAAALYYAGVRIFIFPILAFVYVFALINAVNYQDGIDGQAGTLVFISFLGFLVLSIVAQNDFSFKISLIFLGAVLGFLIYNFPSAKIFMGDSGAYLLGFAVAALSIIFFGNIISHLLILGLPLFDGICSNTRRVIKGKSIFLGDRQHFYDRMMKRGFSVKETLLISAVLQTLFVCAGILVFIYA